MPPMSDADLESSSDIDLASIELNFERFRLLSRNPNLSAHEKIGFPDTYRESYEAAIFADIQAKLPSLADRGAVVIDIGPGCADLPKMMIELTASRGQSLVLVDSPEMLAQLPNAPHLRKVEGAFPGNIDRVRAAAGQHAAVILCYSVLHYMYVDTNLFDVVDGIMNLLAPGGSALIGDIPNLSKRRRFFGSPTGIAFHKAFMGTDDAPTVTFNSVEAGRIDDAVLAGLVHRCQLAGCDAYVVPQPTSLPMANRRDDLLIRRP